MKTPVVMTPASAPAQLTKEWSSAPWRISPGGDRGTAGRWTPRPISGRWPWSPYQLLSGRLPFWQPQSAGLWQLWQMICTEEPLRLRA